MKNLLWLFYKPADEREESIYKEAFERSFAIMILILAGTIFQSLIYSIEASSDTIALYCSGLLIIGYIAGWSRLKNEELTLEYKKLPDFRTKKYLTILGIIGLVSLLLLIGLAFTSSFIAFYLFYLLLSVFLIHIILLHWTWTVAEPLPKYIRLVATLLLGPGFILFMKWKKKNVWTLIGSQIVASALYAVLFVVLLIPLRLFVVQPFYIETDYYAPEYSQGDYVIVQMGTKGVQTGDYVIYKDQEQEVFVGLVQDIIDSAYSIESSVGLYTVPEDMLIGEVTMKIKW